MAIDQGEQAGEAPRSTVWCLSVDEFMPIYEAATADGAGSAWTTRSWAHPRAEQMTSADREALDELVLAMNADGKQVYFGPGFDVKQGCYDDAHPAMSIHTLQVGPRAVTSPEMDQSAGDGDHPAETFAP